MCADLKSYIYEVSFLLGLYLDIEPKSRKKNDKKALMNENFENNMCMGCSCTLVIFRPLFGRYKIPETPIST